MNTEERLARLEKAVEEQHRTLITLTNKEITLRDFAKAVAQQNSIDCETLYETYLGLFDEATAQIPPSIQDRDAFEKLGKALAHILNERRRLGL